MPPDHYSVMPRFAEPKIDKARPALSPTRANFISGDPHGLQSLADRMYGYVTAKADPMVRGLVDTVTRMVKDDDQLGGYTPGPDGGWIGETAYVFRDTFITDAAMMNGLDSVICSVAKTVDDLAAGLSSLEYHLEIEIERAIIKAFQKKGAARLNFDLNWLTTVGSGTHPSFQFSARGASVLNNSGAAIGVPILNICGETANPFFKDADKLRHTAGSKLIAVGRILEEAFSYYANYSAAPNSPMTGDPSVLITSSQSTADNKAIKSLEGKYTKLAEQLQESSLDPAAAVLTLKNLGVAVDKANQIVGGIKGLKAAAKAEGAGNKFMSIAGQIIPILMMIGLGAA